MEYQFLLIVLYGTTHTTAFGERTVKIVIPIDWVILLEWIGKVKIGVKEDQ